MDIALPAIISLALILPAIIFYRVRRPAWRVPESPSLLQEMLAGAAVCFVAHALVIIAGFCAYHCKLTDNYPNFDATLVLLSGTNFDDDTKLSYRALSTHPIAVTVYFGLVYGVAYLSGWGLRCLEERKRRNAITVAQFLSHTPNFMRFAEWSGMFRGTKFKRTKENAKQAQKQAVCYLAGVVEIAGEAYVFVGIVDDIEFGKDGNPDRIIFYALFRRPIKEDDPEQTKVDPDNDCRYYKLHGDILIVNYSQLRTVAVTFFIFVSETCPEHPKSTIKQRWFARQFGFLKSVFGEKASNANAELTPASSSVDSAQLQPSTSPIQLDEAQDHVPNS